MISSIHTKLIQSGKTNAYTSQEAHGTITISGTSHQLMGICRDGSNRYGFAYFNNAMTVGYVDMTTSYMNITDNVVTL